MADVKTVKKSLPYSQNCAFVYGCRRGKRWSDLKSDNSVYLDQTYVRLEDLVEALKAKVENHKDPGVLLFADRSIQYQALFQVLDQIRLAGINRISLQAELEQNP